MKQITKAPPDPDEFELTLLGRGVGESCVVHLGEGRWMIVDSFKVDGRPAALSYLDDVGVSPEQVEHLVVTHFHTDHYRGIESLHDDCVNAVLHVTEALEADEFLKLHVYDEEPSFLEGMPGVIRRAKSRRIRAGDADIPGFETLRLGVTMIDDAGVRVRALSPTRDAIAASVAQVSAALSTRDSAEVTASLKKENRSSVAMHLDATDAFGCSVLLGADLVAEPRSLGWHAVINDPVHANLTSTQLTKVAHHGSEDNHYQPAWDALTDPGSVLMLAPYWSSSLPRDRDIARLKEHGDLYVAGPQVSWRDVDGHRKTVDIEIGVVQARRHRGEGAWRVACRPPAYQP